MSIIVLVISRLNKIVRCLISRPTVETQKATASAACCNSGFARKTHDLGPPTIRECLLASVAAAAVPTPSIDRNPVSLSLPTSLPIPPNTNERFIRSACLFVGWAARLGASHLHRLPQPCLASVLLARRATAATCFGRPGLGRHATQLG
jgi:hypothetical protein